SRRESARLTNSPTRKNGADPVSRLRRNRLTGEGHWVRRHRLASTPPRVRGPPPPPNPPPARRQQQEQRHADTAARPQTQALSDFGDRSPFVRHLSRPAPVPPIRRVCFPLRPIARRISDHPSGC